MKYPVIDTGKCSLCLGCIEIAPDVFVYDSSLGILQVCDLRCYPENDIEEAIKNCPEKCITWDGVERTPDS